MTGNLNNLFSDAFKEHCASIPYSLGQALARAYPDDTVIQVDPEGLDVREYAKDGHCQAELRMFPHPQEVASWDDENNEFDVESSNTFFDVIWQGYSLRFIEATWYAGGFEESARWLVCRSREIAEQFLIEITRWYEDLTGEILVFEGGCWRKSEELFESVQLATFENLILAPTLKDEILSDFEQFFAAKDEYARYGLPWKRGVLFHGLPGNGKTHTIKALINKLGKSCLYVKSLSETRHNTDHEMIHKVFARARKSTPCMLIFEDLDSMITNGNRSFFLNELDGFAKNDGIIVVASTNHPEKLDPAIVDRPSRFDRKYAFALPAVQQRRDYLEMWSNRVGDGLKLSETGFEKIAAATDDFSFAYLKELWISSMMAWMVQKEEGTMDEIMANQLEKLRQQMRKASNSSKTKTDQPD